MTTWIVRIAVACSACGMLLSLGGCAKSFTARKYPAFYDPNLRTVAVVPFANETYTQGAGILVAEDLAAALQLNGTYTIISPRQLLTFVRQKKLEELSERDSAQDGEVFRGFGSVQAFVMGRVLRAGTFAQSDPGSHNYAGDCVPRPYRAD
jgi:hypothetical protein